MVAVEELGAVRGGFEVEKVGEVELGQELDDVFLAGGMVGIALQALLPYLLHGPVRAEAGDEIVRLGAQAEILVVEGVARGRTRFRRGRAAGAPRPWDAGAP